MTETLTTLDALRRAICAAPDDDIVRGAFADALDERNEPGDAERAEFIRVQCELAKRPTDAVLLNRECQLFRSGVGVWEYFRDSFPGFLVFTPSQCQPGNYTGDQHVCARRGFVSEVRAPLSVLIGGACERCTEGRRGRYIEQEGDTIGQYTRWEDCPACSGTGRTVGVLPGIVQREPVAKVVATDREPGGASDDYYWFDESKNATGFSNRHHIPAEVYRLIQGGIEEGNVKMFDSHDLAHSALSAALLMWGKSA